MGEVRVRRAATVVAVTVLLALGSVATGLGGAPAGAGIGPAIDYCSYTVDPPILTGGGGTVTVSGVAPPNAEVFAYLDGVVQQPAPITTADPVTGAWSFQIFLADTAFLQVAVDSYPPTECSVDQAAQQELLNRAIARARAAGKLSYTGAGHVRTEVMLGLVMVALGAVLVVSVRRRETFRGRNGSQ